MPRCVSLGVSYKGGRARALFTVQKHKYCKYEYLRCQYKRANTDAAPAGAERYAKVGARVPSGVLLCGPPGTQFTCFTSTKGYKY